jgi:hypothetical protein
LAPYDLSKIVTAEWSLVGSDWREASRTQGEPIMRGPRWGGQRCFLNRQLTGSCASMDGVAGKGILGSGDGMCKGPEVEKKGTVGGNWQEFSSRSAGTSLPTV